MLRPINPSPMIATALWPDALLFIPVPPQSLKVHCMESRAWPGPTRKHVTLTISNGILQRRPSSFSATALSAVARPGELPMRAVDLPSVGADLGSCEAETEQPPAR